MRHKKSNRPLEYLNEVLIVDTAVDGRGIAKVDNRVIFVKGGIPDDVVNIAVKKVKSNLFEAEITEIVAASPGRVKPFCAHFGLCGGCKWQHMSYAYQMKYKQKQVEDALIRLGKIELPQSLGLLGAEVLTEYRNKMGYTFTNRKWLTEAEIGLGESIERDGVGFHIPGKFDKIVHVEKCYLQDNLSNEIRNQLHEFCKNLGLSYYDPYTKAGLLRNLYLRNTKAGDWMVMMVFGENNQENIQKILHFLQSTFAQIKTLVYIVNQKVNDSLDDQIVEPYYGPGFLIEELNGIKFKISPKSFFQTNAYQIKALYDLVKQYAGITKNKIVYDLYTGTGSIALYCAADAAKVVGIEYVEDAIADAKFNAELNGISNCSFFAGNMKELLTDGFIAQNGKPDVIITDPPRNGMDGEVVDMLIKIAAPLVVYVSCNASTQARDLERMKLLYKVVAYRPVDMFPYTHHVENVVLLERIEH